TFDFSGVSKKTTAIVFVICIITFSLGLYILLSDSSTEKIKSNVYAQPKTASVLLGPSGFEPKTLQIEKDTTVTFVNRSTNPYWLTSSQGTSLEGFGSVINPGESYTFVYEAPGIWQYREQTYGKFEVVVDVAESK